ncbi:MAG TPA: hypothetical protein V6C69_05150 [Trichormus sp.]|jgi:hypothetical protein
MNGDKPKLIGIILCELVLQDILRREAISCVNIHNGIATQAFPVTLPLVYGFAQLHGVTKQFGYQFKLIDPNGQLLATSPPTNVEPLPNQNVTHKIINAFTGLTFAQEGTYQVTLEVDGEEIGSLPFHVVYMPPQPGQGMPQQGQATA